MAGKAYAAKTPQRWTRDGPVIFDCRVSKLANCFPMIPSGAAHTDMILSDHKVTGEMSDEAKALV
jgi:acetolactate synthase I/II/III large subunit